MSDIERIINAKEVLEENKNKLLKLYVEDYGKKNEQLLKQRMNAGFYLFESEPDVTFEFLEQYAPMHHEIERVALEAEDYQQKKEMLRKNLREEISKILIKHLKPSKENSKTEFFFKFYQEEFITLIKTFSSPLLKAKIQDSDFVVFKNTQEKEEKYIKICNELGIEPLIDPTIVDEMLKQISKKQDDYHNNLITNTLWGQRIHIIISRYIGRKIPTEVVASIMFTHLVACGGIRIKNSNQVKTILRCPLMQIYGNMDLDDAFLHENRHLIETGISGSGIDNHNEYTTLNEIRVENHAVKDLARIEPIFSRKPGNHSVYQILFPATDELIEPYESYLDILALNTDAVSLEKTFGQKRIREFNKVLTDTCDKAVIALNPYLNLAITLKQQTFYDQIDILKRNAKRNGIKAYKKNK